MGSREQQDDSLPKWNRGKQKEWREGQRFGADRLTFVWKQRQSLQEGDQTLPGSSCVSGAESAI